MTLVLRPVGRGNWTPVRLMYDARLRTELPLPIEAKRGATLELFGRTYRVAGVLG